jgi:tetratricopeptide (TPR) repeat protein
LTDAFAIQDSIGRSVATALEIRLASGGRSRRLARHMTSDPVALDLYIRGHDPSLSRSISGQRAAVGYFSQALAYDSTFAGAYAGLAHAYITLARGAGTSLPRHELVDNAEKAARKAVALDDSLGEAHTSLAFAKLTTQDFRAASAELKRALELDPDDFFARTLGAVLYNWSGRHEDAVTELRRVVDADPSHRIDLAMALFFAGHDDDALRELEPLRALRPPLRRTPQLASEIYLHKRMWKQAVDEFTTSIDSGTPMSAALGLALGKSGDRDGAMRILQELKERHHAGTGSAFQVAMVYVGLDDYDQAFVWLDKALDDHSVLFTIMDPTFAELRKDPRFARFRQRLGVDAIQWK